MEEKSYFAIKNLSIKEIQDYRMVTSSMTSLKASTAEFFSGPAISPDR
jgi:hypothetical protein